MRKFCIHLCVMVVLLGTASCTVGNYERAEDQFVLSSFLANYPPLELDADTKSEAGEVVYKMYWNVGDELAIVNVTQGYRVDKYISQSRVRNFEGAGQFLAAGTYTYSPTDIVFIAYPYAAISLVDDGGVKRLANNKLTVTLADNLSYSSKSNSPVFARNEIQVSSLLSANSLRSYGDAAGSPGIDLTRLVAMLRVVSHLSSEDIASLSLNSLEFCAKGISGTQDVTFSGSTVGSTPSFVRSGGGDRNSLTVNLPNRPTAVSASAIVEFIPVFPIWVGRDSEHDGFSLIYDTDDRQMGFRREVNGYWGSNAVIVLNIYEGTYTRVATRSLAVGDLRWWSALKDSNPFNGEITPGVYQEGTLPGSSTGAYEDRSF